MKSLATIVAVSLLLTSGVLAKAKKASRPTPKPKPPVTATAVVAPAPAPVPALLPPPTPPPEPVAPPLPPPPPEPLVSKRAEIDLAGIASETQELRDELETARAKVELVGSALYKTKIAIRFRYGPGRAWPLKKAIIKIDDYPLYTGDSGADGREARLHEGFVTPGRHWLTLRFEAGAVGTDRFGLSGEQTFLVDLKEGKLSQLSLSIEEEGDGPQALAKKQEGTFDVRLKLKVKQLDLTRQGTP